MATNSFGKPVGQSCWSLTFNTLDQQVIITCIDRGHIKYNQYLVIIAIKIVNLLQIHNYKLSTL